MEGKSAQDFRVVEALGGWLDWRVLEWRVEGVGGYWLGWRVLGIGGYWRVLEGVGGWPLRGWSRLEGVGGKMERLQAMQSWWRGLEVGVDEGH